MECHPDEEISLTSASRYLRMIKLFEENIKHDLIYGAQTWLEEMISCDVELEKECIRIYRKGDKYYV